MKLRLISLIAVLFFPVVSQADVVFLNKNNTSYNLEVTYKFCTWQDGQYEWKCGAINKAKIDGGSKNYIVIPTPELPVGMAVEAIFIDSAVMKDNRGNIVAQGSYDGGPSIAYSDLTTGNVSKSSWMINFNSILGIGAIGIDYSKYQYVGPEATFKLPTSKNLI